MEAAPEQKGQIIVLRSFEMSSKSRFSMISYWLPRVFHVTFPGVGVVSVGARVRSDPPLVMPGHPDHTTFQTVACRDSQQRRQNATLVERSPPATLPTVLGCIAGPSFHWAAQTRIVRAICVQPPRSANNFFVNLRRAVHRAFWAPNWPVCVDGGFGISYSHWWSTTSHEILIPLSIHIAKTQRTAYSVLCSGIHLHSSPKPHQQLIHTHTNIASRSL
jgi:hypothetical protein